MKSLAQKDKTTQDKMIGYLQKGDEKSISELYQKYSPALYSIILNIVHQEEIAQEILQDTFIKIWQKSDSFSCKKGRLFTWMARIARNTSIDRIRSKNYKNGKRLNASYQNCDLENQVGLPMNLPDSGLMDIISKMDKKYEDVLFAIYMHGYTQQQASKKLNISLGTVKTRSRTGLKIMHRLLQAEKHLCI